MRSIGPAGRVDKAVTDSQYPAYVLQLVISPSFQLKM